MADEHPHRAPAGLLAGTPYRVVQRLGVAPTGELFEVEHVELGKLFALKTLPQSGPRFDRVERLRNEFRALARLAHPNIVAVTDAGTTSRGVPYFVMPRYRSETLAARLRRGPLRVTEALGVAADIASALGAAHGIGIVHRDVRPDNILLERGGAKLADFGVAKFLGSTGLTTRHLGLGTPRYMSPEHASGGRLGARSDLYSLGLVLFEMIGGAGPDDDVADDAALLVRRTSQAAPRLATRVPGLDAEIDGLVAKLLALDPALRPRNALGVASQLRAIAARVAGAIAADAPTREVHYDAVTDPGPAAHVAGGAPEDDATATRPDGIAAAERAVADARPARDEPPTRFDLPRRGAPRDAVTENEPTTERIVHAIAAPRVERAAPSQARFVAICAAIGALAGLLLVIAGALVMWPATGPAPVAARRVEPVRRAVARAPAPAAPTSNGTRSAPPPAPPPPTSSAGPSAPEPSVERADSPPRRQPPRRAQRVVPRAAVASACAAAAPAPSSGPLLPASGL